VVPPAIINVYNSLINHDSCILTATHREKLMTERGFSPDIIDACRFRSCGPHMEQVVADLQQQYGSELLVSHGVIVPRKDLSGFRTYAPLLDDSLQLIPHLNQHGEVYFIQIHKESGFKGQGIEPYLIGTGSYSATGIVNHSLAILTESAYKAVAAYQYGYSAVGIPGIQSCYRKHFDKLCSLMTGEGITDIRIIFDNEIKNDPELPGYKVNEVVRWDTPLYAILMTRKLQESGLFNDVSICPLPDAWRVNGKIDIDGALGQGYTVEAFQSVVASKRTWLEYLRSLNEEAQRVVSRHMDRAYLSRRVERRYNGYYVMEKDGEFARVSDFTMDFTAKVMTMVDGEPRTCRHVAFYPPHHPLGHHNGLHGTPVTDFSGSEINPSDLPAVRSWKSSPDCISQLGRFKAFALSSGISNHHFWGNPQNFDLVVRYEDLRAGDRLIIEPNQIGYLPEHDVWLFANGAYINGEFVPPDPVSKASWNGQHGYKCGLGNIANGEVDYRGLPSPDFSNLDQVDIKDIARRLFRNYGGAERSGHEALLVFSWTLAAIYSDAIYEHLEGFPIMFMLGEPQSGKTTLGRWSGRMFGITRGDSNSDKNTSVAWERNISLLDNIPLFLDECRDMGLSSGNKESLLRSVYDRSPIKKGTRNDTNETRVVIPRAPVMIGGEHRPSDAALNTRCLLAIFRNMSVEDKEAGKVGAEYKEIRDNLSRTLFPKVLPWVLTNGPSAEEMIATLRETSSTLKGDARACNNYGAVLAAYSLIINPEPEDEFGFTEWVARRCEDVTGESVVQKPSDEFLEDLPMLARMGVIRSGVHYASYTGVFYLAIRQAYSEWLKQRPARDRGMPGSVSIQSILRKEDYVIAEKCRRFRIGTGRPNCIAINPAHPACPQGLAEWIMNQEFTPEPTGPSKGNPEQATF